MMTSRKPPRKYRSTAIPERRKRQPEQQDDTRGYNAPSHMGGQFEDSGYASGIGQFGFQHDVRPPSDRR